MSQAALQVHKSSSRRSISREVAAELQEDLIEVKKNYQRKVMKLAELRQDRLNRNRVIRAVTDDIKHLEGEMAYLTRKLGSQKMEGVKE